MQNTVLYQLRTESSVISGMSYVVRCGDGSIFVIDGGYDHGDAEILMTFLKGLTQSDHPVVDAWLITHGHPDHTGALQGVARRHYKEITVKKLIYRWPKEDFIKASQPAVLRQLETLEKDLVNLNAEHVVPSTGDVYRFGDSEFEVLLTCDKLDPIKPGDHRDFNDSSTVVRLKANGQTVLFLGDVAAAGDRVMIDMHGKYLKSDVCQLAHHGFASTAEFYDYVDPEILLWPVDEKRVPVQMRYNGVNRHLVCEMNVKRIFLSDRGTVCLPLPVSAQGESYMPPLVPHVKSEEPLFDIRRAPEGFNWSDASDGGWDKACEVTLKPEKPDKIKTPASAEAGLLWDDGYLYIRTLFRKDVIPSDPLHKNTTDSTNVRMYFYEGPVTDCYQDWSSLRGETGVIEKLLMYPEIKAGFETLTDSPGFCEASCVPVDGGFCITARIRLAREHRSGDVVSINLKASANDVPGGPRTSCLSMLEPEPAKYIHIRPACMVLARLA